jgi:predicted NAD/FAD-binding protein
MLEEGAKIAIVGSGISGITAAHILQRRYHVTLFESEPTLGGHAHTVTVQDPLMGSVGIDMGFIVLNDRNYPLFNRFLKELKVEIQPSEMSFGLYCEETGFTYSGMSLNGIFADRKNLLNPKFFKFLLELKKFCSISLKALEKVELEDLTLGQFLVQNEISQQLKDFYLIPMGKAIWSATNQEVLTYPAKAFLNFFKNHGLLDLADRPQWQTIAGGSKTYINNFQRGFRGEIRFNSPVQGVGRSDGIFVDVNGSKEKFSAVILATHAPTSLKLLNNPSDLEIKLLSPWKYSQNKVTLHTDINLLPPNKRAWASWNYRKTSAHSLLPKVTYWMNNLQSLNSKKTYCVSLNSEVAPNKIIKSVDFEHPVFDSQSLKSQKQLSQIQDSGGVYFCGAYFGNGFHEDGCRSGQEVASLLGVSW